MAAFLFLVVVLLAGVTCGDFMDAVPAQTASAKADTGRRAPRWRQQKLPVVPLETDSEVRDDHDPSSPCSSVASNGSGPCSPLVSEVLQRDADGYSLFGSYADLLRPELHDYSDDKPMFTRFTDLECYEDIGDTSSAEGAVWGIHDDDDLDDDDMMDNDSAVDLGRGVFEIMTQDGSSTQDDQEVGDFYDRMPSLGKRLRLEDLGDSMKRLRILSCSLDDNDALETLESAFE